MDKQLQRAVIVTNRGHPAEGVVIAVEMFPWHASKEEAKACTDPDCKFRFHRMATVEQFVFDFDMQEVLLIGEEMQPPFIEPIPQEDLEKFKADFGLYYAS